MTKLDGRTKEEAAKQLDESLQRLQTDHIDLVQLHEIIRFEDPERIFDDRARNGGAIEARKPARFVLSGSPGTKIRTFTCTCLKVAKEHGFGFDTVQMPLNVMDAHYRSFEKKVLPVLVNRHRRARNEVAGQRNNLESKTVTAIECLHYAMNLPTSVVITGCEAWKCSSRR